jgi:hypothetical protein
MCLTRHYTYIAATDQRYKAPKKVIYSNGLIAFLAVELVGVFVWLAKLILDPEN